MNFLLTLQISVLNFYKLKTLKKSGLLQSSPLTENSSSNFEEKGQQEAQNYKKSDKDKSSLFSVSISHAWFSTRFIFHILLSIRSYFNNVGCPIIPLGKSEDFRLSSTFQLANKSLTRASHETSTSSATPLLSHNCEILGYWAGDTW